MINLVPNTSLSLSPCATLIHKATPARIWSLNISGSSTTFTYNHSQIPPIFQICPLLSIPIAPRLVRLSSSLLTGHPAFYVFSFKSILHTAARLIIHLKKKWHHHFSHKIEVPFSPTSPTTFSTFAFMHTNGRSSIP